MVSYTREIKKLNKILISGVAVAMVATVAAANVAYGLTYSQDIGVSFTFNPVIGLTFSASDLIISNLSPGTAADSNVIDINILTNNTNGYTLNASVGNNTTFDTRNLIHTNNTVSNTFSSIDIGSNISDKTNLNDNTWAYSYSIDSGTTWTGYNGLPLYSDTTNIAQLKNSTAPVSSASGDNIKFKIAAKASTTQASGEYRNVINFQLTATPLPTTLSMAYANAGKEKLNGYYKLQDMTADICNAAEVLDEGSQMQAIDTRDNKVYWVTKLRDGKCWFTQNLDHDIDKDFAYTPENTDIPINWVPDKSTYQTGDTTWGNNVILQESYNPGNKIWDGMPNSTGYILDNMLQSANHHYHLGNYYSWAAATAMNIAGGSPGDDIDQSICPVGWTLPKSGSSYTGVGSFRYMVEQYGWNDSDRVMDDPRLWETPLYFTLGGYWIGNSYNVASGGYFWSSVANFEFTGQALYEGFNGSVNPSDKYANEHGLAVRCVSR